MAPARPGSHLDRHSVRPCAHRPRHRYFGIGRPRLGVVVTGWPRALGTGAMTRESFLQLLHVYDGDLVEYIKRFGKPRVRVSAEQRTPKFER